MNVLILYVVIILLSFTFQITAKNKTDFNIKGAVLSHIHQEGSGYGSKKSLEMHKHLKNTGYNSVQINTFCYMRNSELPAIFYGFDSTMDNKYLKNEIKNLKNKAFSVMLKPHLWIGGLEFNPENWRSNIDYSNPGERASWFHNYGKFIINQARIAENNNVDIFVIGTELVKLAKYYEEWKKIIKDVRTNSSPNHSPSNVTRLSPALIGTD